MERVRTAGTNTCQITGTTIIGTNYVTPAPVMFRPRLPAISGRLSFRSWSTARRVKFAVKSGVAVGAASALAYFWPEIRFVASTVDRSSRTALTLAACIRDYKNNYPFEERPEAAVVPAEEDLRRLRAARSAVHRRAAERLLALFRRNGGVYIKLGQHMSALEHVLPVEYSATMSVLHNQAPVSSMADVEAVVREDLDGSSIDDIYVEFDPVPIGAASLAQVHRARLRSNNQEVAVKIQHYHLQAYVDMDLLTVSSAVKVVKRVFPQFELGWLADEMRVNLPKEMDFVAEAHNAERLAKNLEHTWPTNCPVHIPQIHWEATCKRMLVMEYCPGVKVVDLDWIKANGIDPRDVSANLTRLFSQMMFLHGFVHCDPHPGNIFLQKDEQGPSGYRIVVLDHGLYRELPDVFRLNYAKLWKSLVDGKPDRIKRYAERLGGGYAYKLFSVVLTHRSWDSMTSAKDWDRPRKSVDVARFRDRASDYLPIVAELLAKVPRPLLLLLKTNDLLRAVDRVLQSDNPLVPSPTFMIMSSYCVQAINENRWNRARGSLFREVRALSLNFMERVRFGAKRMLFWIYVKLVSVSVLV